MRRIGFGIVAGVAFLLSTGLMTPAHANVTDFGIDSPNDGEATRSQVVGVQMHGESDSSNGLQYMRLELKGPAFDQKVVWCAPGPAPSCPSWSTGTTSRYNGTWNWDTASLTRYNGEYTLILTIRENGSSPLTQTRNVNVNTPPRTPIWSSITPSNNGGPHVSLRWQANSEPDMLAYKILRSSPKGTSKSYVIDAGNPGASGCSVSGGTFTCTDSSFDSSGYAGSYTYYLSAVRKSPVDSGGVSSTQAARSASVSAPASGSSGGSGTGGSGSGTGGSGTGGSGTGGSGGAGGAPGFLTNGGGLPASLIPSADPNAVDPSEFYKGEYSEKLPYSSRTRVEGVKTRSEAAGFASENDVMPMDARKTLLPIAGGLFTVIAALHFRRVLRDS